MKTYTLDDVKNFPIYHREMWEYVAEHPEQEDILVKEAWLIRFWNDNAPNMVCFACHYAHNITKEDATMCDYCPLDQHIIGCNIACGLYELWDGEEDLEKRSKLAKIIANLEWEWKEKEDKHV